MSVVIKAVRERWQVAGGELAARWGGFCLLTLLVFAGYALFIFSMTALNAGGLPNYYQRFRALDGIVDVVTLSMPLRERYTFVAGQPLLRKFGGAQSKPRPRLHSRDQPDAGQ